FAENYEITNGRWFNGQAFEEKTVYIVDGRFSMRKPDGKIAIINLQNQYVIPPFGEAHNHNLTSDWMLEQRARGYLKSGVFYAKMQSSIKKRVEAVKPVMDKFPAIDVSYAHAPLTATGGHPVKLREIFFDRGYFDGIFETKAEIEGHGYFIINTKQDIDDKWPVILSAGPDFIKCNLLYSEEYHTRKDDPEYFGNKGLDPELLPLIVKKAHANNLRVSTHVNSVTDFHHAVVASVDEINHMPAHREAEKINKEDAALAAKKGVVVVTTASLIKNLKEKSPEKYEQIKSNMADNLKLLKEQGVILAVGSDMWDDNSVEEAMFLHSLDVFTNLELLKMWTENSPKTIFPNRKIGELRDGFEASFLALKGNPLEDFKNVKKIKLRVKQGIIIDAGN
ncbi:MAG: amidohydrolase family protein, partial [Gammaproteobacteria bacterium]|nr:amidohydrolase family protein [Gammaproteobacteria bacterium]